MTPAPAARGARHAHTNLIAHDWQRLARFYQEVFGCAPVPPGRDQHGDWLARGTGVPDAHLTGMHLRLPGHGADGPTLEIYSYMRVVGQSEPVANRAGYGHLAFAVDDVAQAVAAVVEAGGSTVGDVVSTIVEGRGRVDQSRPKYAGSPGLVSRRISVTARRSLALRWAKSRLWSLPDSASHRRAYTRACSGGGRASNASP